VRLHRFFFFLLLFLLPTQLGKHFWPSSSLVFGIRVDYLSPTIYLTDILLFLVLGLWIIENLKGLKKIKKQKFRSAFLIFLFSIFLILNCLFAKNKEAAFYKLFKFFEFFLFGFYIFKEKISFKDCSLPILFSLFYSSLISIFQFFNQSSLGEVFYWLGERNFNIQTPGISLGDFFGKLFLRPYGTFSHPNSMAGFFLVSSIFVLFADFGKSFLLKGLKLLTLFFGFLAIIFSFSQAVWLVGFLLGVWYFALLKIKKLRENSFFRKIFNPSYFFLILFFLVFVFSFFRFFEDESFVKRVQLIEVAILMIKNNLIAGVGLNNFVFRLPDFWQTGSLRFLQPVHNIYLLVFAETGLVGLVCFFWFLFLTFRKSLFLPRALFISLIIILSLGLFDHYWLTLQQNQLLAVLVFGLIWGGQKGLNFK
jgi:hypothetical protein